MSGNVGTTSKSIWKEDVHASKPGIQENVTSCQHTNSTELHFDILSKSLNTYQLAPGNSLRGRLHFCHITVALLRLLIQRSQNLGSESLSSLQQEPSTCLTY